MKAFIIILTSLLVISCATDKNYQIEESSETVTEEAANQDKPQRPYRTEARIGKVSKSDPVEIFSAEINGNTLFLEVSYTGGCGLHEFELIGDPAIMKSNPPKRSVVLTHNANNDSCESLVNQKIEVDITELAVTETSGSEIILLLAGHDSPLKYIYE